MCDSHTCPLPGHLGRPGDFLAVPLTPSFGGQRSVLCKCLLLCMLYFSILCPPCLCRRRSPAFPAVPFWAGPGRRSSLPRRGAVAPPQGCWRGGSRLTKPGAETRLAFLCLLNLVLIREKTSYHTVRKHLKGEEALTRPGPARHSAVLLRGFLWVPVPPPAAQLQTSQRMFLFALRLVTECPLSLSPCGMWFSCLTLF